MPPTLANGKICYVLIPSTDAETSARFYGNVFGWEIRKRGDGTTAFNDSVGQVSGAWVSGREPQKNTGTMIYIMVKDMNAACDAVVANGGKIVDRSKPDAREVTATFVDPMGNTMGLYQERGL